MSGAAVPLLLLAGSLGAGKTTLLGRWMADPAFAQTGVLVNEPGQASIDAHLLGFAGAARSLAGGCACCTARGRLGSALDALSAARQGSAPRFERIVVELAGLAHPLPVLEDFAADAELRERFPLHGMATLVDATEGLRGLEGTEARARIRAADVLVIAKSDLVPEAQTESVAAALGRLNPDAEVVRASHGAADAREIWAAAEAASGRELRRIEAALEAGPSFDETHAPRATLADIHGGDLRVHTVRLEAPVELSGFCLRLAGFLDAHRKAVLRVKGMVGERGRRGPAVIQAVGAALAPVRTLKEWPAGAAPGAIVVVARGLDEDTVRAALA